MASILYNVATLHVYLGTEESRTTPESMKLACTHFQCAAWCYSHLKDNYALVLKGDISTELLIFMQHLCFAQAQECILEKSLADNRKSAIVAKVTAQIISYYNSAMAALLTNGEEGQLSDLIGSKLFKEWKRYTRFKVLYLSSILHLYQGQDSEEQQKMGERCALYQAAFDKLEEARKEAKGMQPQDAINEALTFTHDVVEAKRKSAKSENEFIYHEEVPDLSTISAIQGANLVNGIGFDVTDPAILGEDIFHRLVPMQAHETSSLYSEEKAALLRKIVGHVEAKNDELNQFMNSLNVETLNASANALGPEKLPQGLVDRCAALSAKTNAIPDLVSSMSNLAEICTDVESMLNEIGQLLSAEERNETKYQEKVGHRPGGHISELNREYQKYAEAHNKAGESNETLRKAMGLHVANLKVLAQPLQQIQQQIPSCSDKVDEKTLQELRKLLDKVNEMQQQRNELVVKLRQDVTNDDITAQVIAWGDKKLDKLFKKEIAKHDHIVTVLDQNLVAQKNILRALTNVSITFKLGSLLFKFSFEFFAMPTC
jgi:tyrosine-protein phosphatase non-receptor type 23